MKFHVIAAWLTLFTSVCQAQKIKGHIYDVTGNPIPQVLIENITSDRQTVSGKLGEFELEVPSFPAQIRFQHLSYEDELITLDSPPETSWIIHLSPASYQLDPVEIIHHWASRTTPMTFVNYQAKELEPFNTGQDLPYALRYSPSLWVNSDAGNGIGYTSLRIRGSDLSRINVTINGVPLNDAESQYVFWVDLPDFMSSTQQLQIQRGVGTSTNGAGAFGASINLNTQTVSSEPYAQVTGTVGSFGTRRASVELGTGLLKNKIQVDGRISTIHSDGYIDRARADLQSYYLSGTYVGKYTSFRLLGFSGKENTYQAWNGVPATYIDDPELRRYNSSGTERPGSPHPNEVDDYRQSHYQAIWNQKLSSFSDLNITLHYTRGLGYFEQYKGNQNLDDYGITDPNGQIKTTNLIRRRWLDNRFFGMAASWTMRKKAYDWTIGVAGNHYAGQHFGEVTWAGFMGTEEQGLRYYDNDASKSDVSAYSKWDVAFSKDWHSYLDLQVRKINYNFLGTASDGRPLQQTVQLPFFNPKAGLSFTPSPTLKYYISFAIGHHEPNRDDYTESSAASHPLPEGLYNTEAGWEWNGKSASLGINLYHMFYRNQLVLNGQINDVGAYTRVNVAKSYRAGIEIQNRWVGWNSLEVLTNITFSQNRIKAFTDYVDDWDQGGQEAINYRQTPIAFSPAWVNNQQIRYYLWGHPDSDHFGSIQWGWNHVSRQYLDNTGIKSASIPGYWINDLGLMGRIPLPVHKSPGIYKFKICGTTSTPATDGSTDFTPLVMIPDPTILTRDWNKAVNITWLAIIHNLPGIF